MAEMSGNLTIIPTVWTKLQPKEQSMARAYKSYIDTDPLTGNKCLMVYYDPDADDYDQAINQALAFHGFKRGQVTVIALPAKSGPMDKP